MGSGIAVLVSAPRSSHGRAAAASVARALRQMGITRVYTPKDFKITEIMGDVVGIVEKAWLVEG